MIVFLKQEEDL